MWIKNIFILSFVSFLMSDFATAQQTIAKTDSTQLYKNIETYSRKSKFTRFMYRLIFKPVALPHQKRELKGTI